MILDLVFIALAILAYISGAKKGFVKSVWGIAAWILTIVLVWSLCAPFGEYMEKTAVYEKIETAVSQRLEEKAIEQSQQQTEENLPELFLSEVNEMKETAAKDSAQALTSIITKAITYIALIIIIRLLLSAAFVVLNILSKLPLVNATNRLAGGIFGVANMFFVVMLILGIVSVAGITNVILAIQSSSIVKYLYDNNLLMQLFI